MLFQCFVSYVLKAGIYRKHQILAVHRVFFVSVGQRFPLVPYLLHHPRSGTPLEQRHVVPFGTHISLVVVGIPDKTPRQIAQRIHADGIFVYYHPALHRGLFHGEIFENRKGKHKVPLGLRHTSGYQQITVFLFTGGRKITFPTRGRALRKIFSQRIA